MFITTTTQDRRPIFQEPTHAREAVDSLYRTQQLHPFFLFAFVVMPDHCHFLLRVPEPEKISTIMRVYKYGVTFNLGIGAFWQSRFHMRLPEKIGPVLRYIHENPVHAGICERPEEYLWGSACGKWDVSLLSLMDML